MKKQIDNLKSHTDKAPYYDDRHHWSKMSDTWYDIVNQFILDKRLVRHGAFYTKNFEVRQF